uniref:Fibroblast growth factor n=1 Tax=Sinocyclocheilus rhinocerous TaxID=307959 RepID=A0A673HAP3_9TELE
RMSYKKIHHPHSCKHVFSDVKLGILTWGVYGIDSLLQPASIRLQLQATAVGEVVIKGICANRYLAMNSDGRLIGTRRTTDECYFLERLESNNYNTYRSRKYPDWYVALKRTGQYKAGSKTSPGQKAILFLPMSAKC